MPRPPPRGPCPSPDSKDWSSIRRSLPTANLSRSRGTARAGTTTTSTSDRSTASSQLRSDDRCRGGPCAGVVARRATDCVRPCPGRKTRDCRAAGARWCLAAAVRGSAGSRGLEPWGLVVRAFVDAGRQAPGLRRSERPCIQLGDLSVLVRGWRETPADASARESQRHSPGRFSGRAISRVRSREPEPERRRRQRLAAEARAAASVGGTDAN